MSLIPWQAGKNLIWDVTVADTLAASHLPTTSQQPGSAAESAAEQKEMKYSELTNSNVFMPIACETLSPFSSKAISFLCDLGRRISTVTRDPREGATYSSAFRWLSSVSIAFVSRAALSLHLKILRFSCP